MLRIGVKVPNIDGMKLLKKELLFFDKIIIDEELYVQNTKNIELLSQLAGIKIGQNISYWNSSLEFLEDKGVIEFLDFNKFLSESKNVLSEQQLKVLTDSKSFNHGLIDIKNSLKELHEMGTKKAKFKNIDENINALKKLFQHQFTNEEIRTQLYSEMANLVFKEKNFTPIYFEFPEAIEYQKKNTNDAVSFILKKIPLPSEQTTFEKILEFKNNEDCMLKLQRLRKFSNELDITPENFKFKEEEFVYLLNEYKNHISNLDIKFKDSKIQIIVVQSAKFIENLLKLNWSDIAKSVFDIKKHKAEYLIAESKAPGKELAYIHKIESELI